MQQSRSSSVLKKISMILIIFAALLLLGYGLVLLTIGLIQRSEIRRAQASGTAVTVHITEMQPASPNDRTVIVVVEPAEHSPDIPRMIGKTFATTDNRKLKAGDTLTMYYDPANPTDRTVDFGTAAPRIRIGCILTAFGILLLTAAVIILRIMRRKS